MKRFTDFYTAYNFLAEHKMVQIPYPKDSEYIGNFFEKCLYVEVVKVNPETGIIDYDNKEDSKTQVWLEFGPIEYDDHSNEVVPVHDCHLDCGGNTYEEAIINLANLVNLYYHDNGEEKAMAKVDVKTKFYYLVDGNGYATSIVVIETEVYDEHGRRLLTEQSAIDRFSKKEFDMDKVLQSNYKWIEFKGVETDV